MADTSDLEAASARFKTAQTERDDARAELDPLVVKATLADVPQTRIVELTGLTRETVRTILRKAGVKASGRYAQPPDQTDQP